MDIKSLDTTVKIAGLCDVKTWNQDKSQDKSVQVPTTVTTFSALSVKLQHI